MLWAIKAKGYRVGANLGFAPAQDFLAKKIGRVGEEPGQQVKGENGI
jgi:hypothetical protein